MTRQDRRSTNIARAGVCSLALMAALAMGVDLARADATGSELPAVTPAPGVVVDGLDPDGRLRLVVNRSRVLTTAARLRNADRDGAAIMEGASDVATVQPLTANTILVSARKAGSTEFTVEDELGHRQAIEVIVAADLDGLRDQLKDVSPQAAIDVEDVNGSIVLKGHTPTLKDADAAVQMATAYIGSASKVVNLLQISGGQQVMLQVKLAEVSRTAISDLGVNFGYTDGKSFISNNIGEINGYTTNTGNLFTQVLNSTVPAANTQIFGNLLFQKSAMNYFLNCLRENQLMRTLAEPNLTAMSGELAQFQVGGQIPVPVPQSSSNNGAASITVIYENYGVVLNFTPVVLGDGRIRLKIDPEISDLDYAHGVAFGGYVIPGFTTRKVDTTVELGDGQTFAIAGLLNNKVTATTNSLPALGDIPILGALFRSVSYERDQTELVVMVTPHLVEPISPDEVFAGPGENWRYPSESDMFLFRDLGGEAVSDKGGAADAGPGGAGAGGVKTSAPAPQFHGEYGFQPTADTNVLEE